MQRADIREDDHPRTRSDGRLLDRDREREERRAQRLAARGRRSPDELQLMEPPPERGQPGRQTVTITGRGAEAYATRRGTRASGAQRHQSIRRHEREGFRPDRVAMWAVMLGMVLMLAAAASSHAAVLTHAVVLAHHLPLR
jgi:hypothetical protein